MSANNGENILLECPRSTTDGMGDYSWVFNGNYFTNNKVRPYAKCCAINFGIIIIYLCCFMMTECMHVTVHRVTHDLIVNIQLYMVYAA